MTRGQLAVAMILPLLGCGGVGPDVPFPAAAATPSCAPNDAPAVQIDLSLTGAFGPADAFVRLMVYHAPDQVSGRTWALDPPHPDGMALFCPGGKALCETAGRAEVRFDRSGGIAGYVDANFPRSGRIHGRFTAPLREIAVLCG
ncbi:MAG: hypothetical protein AB7S39_23760 [Gemmatimonadales bacterium]